MRKTRKSVSTKKEISQCKTVKEKQEDFIMLPTVYLLQSDRTVAEFGIDNLSIPYR